ncbi:MAG: DNRLRE domain-containing protein, partial [Bacteroidia bacterium]|nr:DNRLRE domain-containing protein [Bacteroidia bacterium]
MKNFTFSLKSIVFVIVLLYSKSILSQVDITCDFIATQDTYIKKKKSDKNYGTCDYILVDREKNDLHRALLQFDLSSIPLNSTIKSAELRLNCTDEKNMSVSVFQIGATDAWDEGILCNGSSSSNWFERNNTSNWSAAGVVGPNPSDGTPISTINGNSLGIHSWPLTSLVDDWYTGAAANNGVMVGSQDGGGDRVITYDSRETSTGIPPVLRVTYTIYLDSDSDGVHDGVDIDDDNDGILDVIECSDIGSPPILDPDFENIDINAGLDGGPTDVTPTSGLWKGDASNIPYWESADPLNNHLEIWSNIQTAGNDVGGQAFTGTQWAEINASTNDGLYQDISTTPGDVLQWSFAHRKRTGYAFSATEDIMTLLIGDPGGTMTSQGNFTSAADASWTEHSGTYTVPAGQTTTRLTFAWVASVSGSSSSGNFVDNVQLYVIPDCEDTDGDLIPDYLDLDSDDDGIPDIIEAGIGNLSGGTATFPVGIFTDTNNNGMHDAVESLSPLDSDGDGTYNFLDLDSDNDAVFDVDEARTERYIFGNLVLENGDGDINGDGVGDGTESEAFRVKVVPGGCTELYGDGIMDKYDYGTGVNQYGNLDQGTAPDYVNNADNTDTPDYIDLDSNNDGIYDIAETLYADLDANNDGVIDDTNDADGDGLVDLFDTNDAQWGSPRDLNRKLHLFFDGRNDYAEDSNV